MIQYRCAGLKHTPCSLVFCQRRQVTFHNSHVVRKHAGHASIKHGTRPPPPIPMHACICSLSCLMHTHDLFHNNQFQSLPPRLLFPGHLQKPAARNDEPALTEC